MNPHHHRSWIATGLMMTAFSSFSVSQYHAVLFQYEHHFSAHQIGQALFWGSLTFFLAPTLLKFASHRGLRASHILGFALLLEALSLYLLPRFSGLSASFSYIFFALSSQMASSLVGSTCLLALEGKSKERNFFVIRSLGTVAFAGTCFANSLLAQHYALKEIYWVFVIAATLAAFFAFASQTPKPQTEQSQKPWSLLREKSLWPLVALLSLANMAAYSGAVYTGSLIRNNFFGSDADVARAWTISTACEVPLIWFAAWLMGKLPLQWIFAIGMFSTAAKLALSALAPDLYWVFVAQIFHGFFFGASLSAVGVLLRRRYSPEIVPIALMTCSLVYSGAATALSGLFSGYLWDHFGLRQTFVFWGVISLITAFATLRLRFESNNA